MALFEDQIIPYLGPGFCSSVSCKFFHNEPFHKPIEGCSSFNNFMNSQLTTSIFDPKFTLHYLWILLQTKNDDAIINNVKFHGASHFIAKEISAVFLIKSFVNISTSLLFQLPLNQKKQHLLMKGQ